MWKETTKEAHQRRVQRFLVTQISQKPRLRPKQEFAEDKGPEKLRAFRQGDLRVVEEDLAVLSEGAVGNPNASTNFSALVSTMM